MLNDDSATVSISSESKVEGTGGTTNYVFSVDLSNPVDVAVSMTADTADGSATAADDYTAVAAAPVGFGVADTTTQTVTVSVAADAKVELDEAFDLVLSSLSAGGRAVTFAGQGITESATADVLNDDSATVSISSESKVEGTGGTTNYVFSVDLSNPVDVAVSMTADTADGSATAADDYTAVAAAPVGFGVADTTTQTVTVSVAADAKVELDEAFDLVLSSLSAGGRAVTFAGAGDHREGATADVLNDDSSNRVDLVRVEGRGDRRDDELCVQRRPVQPGGRGGFDDGRPGRRLGHRRGRLHGRGRSPSRLRRGGYDDADGDGQRGGGRQGGAGRGLRPGA